MTPTSNQVAWSILNEWLVGGGSSVSELQKELLRRRLEQGDHSTLLVKALRLVAEATSAQWASEDVRNAIARLVDPTVFTAPSPSTSFNGTTVTVHVTVSEPALEGIRVA